jgi:hypothetical protein
MKKLLLLSTLLISFVSCKRCYQCTMTQTVSPTSSGMLPTSVTSEFCGTKKEKDAYIKAGTSTARSGNITVTTKTSCY